MSKHYLDVIVYNSQTEGQNVTLTLRDTEGRALIQDNANHIATLTSKEQQDRNDIDANTAKNEQQDTRLNAVEGKNTEQDNKITALVNLTDTHTNEIQALDDRVTATEDDIAVIQEKDTQQDNRLNAVEAKNTEQDGKITALETTTANHETRITANETEIQALDGRVTSNEDAITAIHTKDTEQDEHLKDLDDRVAASTYEAGKGIYFGQGVEHTNINVEDEVLDQINQNTIDIDILKKRKVGTIIKDKSREFDSLSIEGSEKGGLYEYNGKLQYRPYAMILHHNNTPESITVDESFITYFEHFFYSVGGVNGPIVFRINDPSTTTRTADIVVPVQYSAYDSTPVFPVVLTAYFKGFENSDYSDKNYRLEVTVPSTEATVDDITVKVTEVGADLTEINNEITTLKTYVPDPYKAAVTSEDPTEPGVYKTNYTIAGTSFPCLCTVTRFGENSYKKVYTSDCFELTELRGTLDGDRFRDRYKPRINCGYVPLQRGSIDLKALPYGQTLIYPYGSVMNITNGPVNTVRTNESMLVTVSPLMASNNEFPTGYFDDPDIDVVLCRSSDGVNSTRIHYTAVKGKVAGSYTWNTVDSSAIPVEV